jgi:hypothetical protein
MRNPRDPDKRKMPLRRVLGRYVDEQGRRMERLECGHEQHQGWPPRIGPQKRRCRQCFDALERPAF